MPLTSEYREELERWLRQSQAELKEVRAENERLRTEVEQLKKESQALRDGWSEYATSVTGRPHRWFPS